MSIKGMRIKLNQAGIRALLGDSRTRADLAARGNRIAAAAGPGVEVRPETNRDRAVVFVTTATPEARKAEAEQRKLSKAIDAGR